MSVFMANLVHLVLKLDKKKYMQFHNFSIIFVYSVDTNDMGTYFCPLHAR